MTENKTNNDMNKYLFINLVSMLSMSAMQQMGKIINPGTGKAEINLDATQATIDTLDMLSAKTKGNLDNDEARMMTDTLSMLKMNFVETKEEGTKEETEVRKEEPRKPGAAGESAGGGNEKPQDKITPDKPKEEPTTQAEQKPQDKPPSEVPQDTSAKSEPQAQDKSKPQPGTEQGNDPKFHKSYT